MLMDVVCVLLFFLFFGFSIFYFSIFLLGIYTRILSNLIYLWYCQGNGIMHLMFSGWYLGLIVIFAC